MYDRMVHEHGYSIRKLAEKLGKDKGYLENRLRLADAPPEIRELVSLRKDTLSHAYELMKVEDPKKRRRLAEQVARGELTLIKLRDKIEGRRPPPRPRRSTTRSTDRRRDAGDEADAPDEAEPMRSWTVGRGAGEPADATTRWSTPSSTSPTRSRSWSASSATGASAARSARRDRANLAKYLTIAKLRLENAIALVRSDDAGY